jgi:hypothetical protein
LELLYLPPYSPGLDPNVVSFSKIKGIPVEPKSATGGSSYSEGVVIAMVNEKFRTRPKYAAPRELRQYCGTIQSPEAM